jgi:hypothetical protein
MNRTANRTVAFQYATVPQCDYNKKIEGIAVKRTALLLATASFSCLVTSAFATTWKQIANEWFNIDVIAAIDATEKTTDVKITAIGGLPYARDISAIVESSPISRTN